MTRSMEDIETGHGDMIHDAQTNYYGKILATSSSDRTVRLFSIDEDNKQSLVKELRGHSGPVWEVAWAHPRFGNMLASCSYDSKVILWKETENRDWVKLYEHTHHKGSVNSISFAPQEFGLVLACGSSDGSISVLSSQGGGVWSTSTITKAHSIGVNSVTWCPYITDSKSYPMRICSGGCDKLIKIWRFNEDASAWDLESTLDKHTDWVRDVSFTSVASDSVVLASGGQDKNVYLWRFNVETAEWGPAQALKQGGFSQVIWRLSWSTTSNYLAVSLGTTRSASGKKG